MLPLDGNASRRGISQSSTNPYRSLWALSRNSYAESRDGVVNKDDVRAADAVGVVVVVVDINNLIVQGGSTGLGMYARTRYNNGAELTATAFRRP